MDHSAVIDYMAHGCCFLWEPSLVWLHVLSDIITGIAYYSIPIALFYFVYKRRDLEFITILVLFGVFILACGTTHFLAALTVYVPEYWLEGIVKALTAVVSIISAIVLIPLIPQAIAMPSLTRSLEKIQELNRSLEKEMEEREIAANKLKEKEIMLIQQSKMAAMGEMINLIAHQWKQPLNVIAVTSQDINDAYSFGELNADYIGKTQEIIAKQVDFMVKTIDEFRQFLRPSREKVLFDINKAIEELVGMFSEYFVKDNIFINIIAGQGGFSNNMTGYPNEFKQVLLNIINNARDAVLIKRVENGQSDEGLKDNIDISISNSNEGKIIITIRDTGGGIPVDIIDKIFDEHFTTKPSTGIGLYMSKTIIETHMGGKLDVRNIGNGAEFVIEV
ncbi:MAG: HAMP domain-containing histidine kinase [Nitrospirae bacterium]|nr:HAMP domain-containing histidine kinase [Nitrospirota bacterium]